MIRRTFKYGTIAAIALVVTGTFLFGRDAYSYAKSAVNGWRTSVKDSVPVEFELTRAQEMLDEILPEMQANIRTIATEEVELAALRKDIQRTEDSLADQQKKITRLTGLLESDQVYFSFGDNRYSREDLNRDLVNRFERYKEAEMILEGKKQLLVQRQRSLQAAIEMLDQSMHNKALLEQQIPALEGRHRLIKAPQSNTNPHADNSKPARTQKLLGDIKKRLDVAERVMAYEGHFVEPIQMDVVDEQELIGEVQRYFGGRPALTAAETDTGVIEE